MLFSQELLLLWAALELFMAVTHLFVLLGIRNSSLTFLRTQKNYFLLDGCIHMINLLWNCRSIDSIGIACLMIIWSIMFVGHIFYFLNLHRHPPLSHRQRLREPEKESHDIHKLSRIFHWSCVEFQANRFSIVESGKEILETLTDIVAHSSGFYLAFCRIDTFAYRSIALIIMIGLLYRQMLNLKYFIQDPKMMPPVLRKLHEPMVGLSSTANKATQ